MIAENYFPPPQQSVSADAVEPLLSTTEVSTESLIEPVREVKAPVDSDPMALPYIYVRDLNKPSFTGYFADLPASAQGGNDRQAGSTIHYKVDLKNGFKDGDFPEYYENREVKRQCLFI